MNTFEAPTEVKQPDKVDQPKIPEGVTVDRPKIEDRQRKGGIYIPGIPDTPRDPNLPKIVYPHFINNNKTKLACLLMRPDGMTVLENDIPKDDNHPLYRDIRQQFSMEEIELNTMREISVQAQLQKSQSEFDIEQKRVQRREELWNQKSTFLEMDVVKNTKYKSLKRKLRSATSPHEAQAYGIAILIKETEIDESN